MTDADEARARIAWEDPVSKPPLTFRALSAANVSRAKRWHGGDVEPWTGADWSNAMNGEAGEAANVVKKLRRIETRITQGSYHGDETTSTVREELVAKLADEIADTIIYADLLADHYGINVARAVRDKFNRVSAAQEFPERI